MRVREDGVGREMHLLPWLQWRYSLSYVVVSANDYCSIAKMSVC